MSTLGYWNIRGFAQPIRFLLEYVGEDYKEKLYQQGDGPEFSKECWRKEKFTLGLDFPNLPYYMDEKVKLSQSCAILTYLARKYRLEGSTDDEKLRVDLVFTEILDLREAFTVLVYKPNYKSLRKDYASNWMPRIQALDTYLGDRKWFAGDKLTYADFIVYEVLLDNRRLELDLFDNTPNLNAFSKRFEELPRVKECIASGKIPRAINNTVAAAFNEI